MRGVLFVIGGLIAINVAWTLAVFALAGALMLCLWQPIFWLIIPAVVAYVVCVANNWH